MNTVVLLIVSIFPALIKMPQIFISEVLEISYIIEKCGINKTRSLGGLCFYTQVLKTANILRHELN